MITDCLSIINKRWKEYKRKWEKLSQKQKIQRVGIVLIFTAIFIFSFYSFSNREAEADWFDDGWHYRRKLTFGNASSTEHLTNFPVLVSLSSLRINYSNTQNSGQDIRFTDPNGSLLEYEIEEWNESGTSTVWVKIPQIDAQSTIDHIYMYYGNPDASDAQDAENVWDSNFKMVQHLQEASTSSNAYIDSTSNNNDGTASSTVSAANLDATGKIDGANEFDGADDDINVGSNSSIDNIFDGGGTMEVWISADSDGESSAGRIYQKATTPGAHPFMNDESGGVCDFYWAYGFTTAAGYWATTDRDITLGNLTYIVVTYDANATSNDPTIYVDNVVKTVGSGLTETQAPDGTRVDESASDLYIGNRENSERTFDGIIDEFRLSDIVRSADWIEAQHKSMTDNFITFGGEENQEGAIVFWNFDEGSDSTAYDGSNYDNDLTISGASWITGKAGKGLSFNGSSDKATTSDSVTLSPTGTFSISAWIKRDADSNIDIIANKWNDSSHSYKFSIDASDKLSLDLEKSGAGSTSVSGNTIADTSDWHHVAAVYNHSSPLVQLYIDGQSETVTTSGWEAEETADLPVQLRGAGAIYKDANEVYIFGGYDNTNSQFNTNVYKFDPSSPTNNATDTGHDLPQAIQYAPAAYYSSGDKAYIFGGYWLGSSEEVHYTDEITEYNVSTGATATTSIGNLPVELAGASAVFNSSDNLIYIFGGYDNTNSQFNATIYKFDPSSASTNATTTGHSLPSGRRDTAAVYDSATSKFYIFGGYYGTSTPTYLNEIVQYDYSTGTATTTSIGSLPIELRGHSAVYKDSDEIYIFGGWDNTNSNFNANIYKFDPSSPSSTSTDTTYDISQALKDAPAIYDTSGGKSYIFGGYHGTTTPTYLDDIVKVDLNTSTVISSITDGTQDFVVGAGESTAGSYANFFGGDIDELYLYNFALTAAQVRRSYNIELSVALPIQFGADSPATSSDAIAYYRVDKGSGATAYDDSSNDNDLAISGASWTTSGKFGNALSFDGTNDQATTSDSTSLNITGSLSIAAWVKATDFSTTTLQWLVHKDSGSAGYGFGFGSTTNDLFLSIDGTKYESSANFSLTNNTWHHLGVSLSGTSTTFYIDGQQLGNVVNGANAPPASATATILRIGSDGTNYFSGILDEIMIYNYARTALEIRTDYNKGMAVSLGEGDISGGISGVGGSDGWWDARWHKRIKLTIDNSASTETLTNFPTLVTLTSSQISYSDTQNLGQDIRFTDNHGVELKYEIEKWDEAATSTVWVKIPSITALSTNEFIYMYYNNPDASDAQNVENVWNSNFKMVQHLQEASTSTDAYVDSTSNDNDATASSTVAAANLDVTGKIDGANEFDGSDDYIKDTNSVSITGTSLSVGVWFYPHFNSSGHDSTSYGFVNIIITGDDKVQLYNYKNDFYGVAHYAGGTARFVSAGTFTANSWHYLVYTFNDSDNFIKMYHNGVFQNTATSTNEMAAGATNTYIGSMTHEYYLFDGILDELQISDTVWSAEWIEAQYKSMTDAFLTYGSAEKQPKPIAIWRLDEGQGVTIYDDTNYDNDGTIPTSTASHWATSTLAKYGKAIDFDGTNDYVTVSDSTSISITGDLTVSAWIRPDAVSKEQTIIGKWDETTANNDRSYRLWLDSSNKFNFSVSTDGSASTTHTGTNTTFSAGTWYHVEAVYDANSTMDVYVNGQLDVAQKSSSVPASIDDNVSNLYIGAKENTAGSIDTKFDGAIDDVRIYNYTRSASQVFVDYNGGFSSWLGE